jgi:hypothetical protein
MADEMKVKRPSIEPGKYLLEIAWRTEAIKSLVTKKRPLITKESAKLANLNFAYSNDKTVRTLNYNFKPVKETIAETTNIYIESIKAKKEFGVFEKIYA